MFEKNGNIYCLEHVFFSFTIYAKLLLVVGYINFADSF